MYEYCWWISLYNHYVTFKLLFSVIKLRQFEFIFKEDEEEEEEEEQQQQQAIALAEAAATA